MDFSKILNLANANKNRAEEEVKIRKNLLKAKMKANNVKNDAVKRFLERKELEKRRGEAREAQRKEDLLSLRAAAKHNRKANAMARRTKDNNFGKFEEKTDEMEPDTAVTASKVKTQENLRPVGLKDVPMIRTNSVNHRQNVRDVTKAAELSKRKSQAPQRDNKSSFVQERVQAKINFPAKKAAKSMDFNALMKLAKTKQHEPIKMPEKKKVEDSGRLMTQAEKRRFLEEQARKLGISVIIPGDDDRNAKQNKAESSKKPTLAAKPTKSESHKPSKTTTPNIGQIKNTNSSTATSSKVPFSTPKCLPAPPRPMMTTKQFPPRDLMPMTAKPRLTDAQNRSKMFNPIHSKFPDANRHVSRGPPPPPYRPEYVRATRQFVEDEDEDEEMSDFIDDGPMGESEDYSKHIREIFGYDKRKYALLDNDEDCIESSFSRQMQEESYSTRVGLLEDLEDIKREQEELERQYKSHKKRKL